MICSDIQAPMFLIFSDSIPSLIYYSHIPTAISALVVGFFIFFKSRTLEGKLLFLISVFFSLWNFFNLILWTNINSDIVIFFWSLSSMSEIILFLLAFYFSYVFIRKSDVELKYKIFWTVISAPFFLWSIKIVDYFNLADCSVVQGVAMTYMAYIFEFVVFAGILFDAYFQYKKETEIKSRKQIVLFILGLELFLGVFLASGFIANLLYENGFKYAFQVEQYGLFGMPIFLSFLAYLIVKFKAFNVKLIGVQALVTVLIILVGSQFFFASENTSIVLTGITLSLSLGFGYILIKSVKEEIAQKEALEIANEKISERGQQLQVMADSLAVANDQLRKLDNAKTEFISIASHQLRTPITAIKGFVSLILEGSYGEIEIGVKGALEKVYVSSERLVQLIEDLLNVSRIESGRMIFAFEKASVEKLLKELYENFVLISRAKKFYFELKLPEEPLPEIVMDYSKIRELVSNFIDNALKYTEKGGIKIKAEIRKEGVVIDESGFVVPEKKSDFGRMLRITVSDTGIGIPKDEIPHLFRKFSRGKDVSRLHVGGTGLGLYVGKAIVEAHHGQVWVESEGTGLGSKFIIEIPLEHVE